MRKLLTCITTTFLLCNYAIGQTTEDAFLIDLDAEATIERWEKEDIKVEVYWTEKGTSRYVMEQTVPKSEYLQTGIEKANIVINTLDVKEWTANIIYLIYVPKDVELTIESEYITLSDE